MSIGTIEAPCDAADLLDYLETLDGHGLVITDTDLLRAALGLPVGCEKCGADISEVEEYVYTETGRECEKCEKCDRASAKE